MPFDFKAYDEKCNGLTLEELQREWEHYTRLISGAATSTAVSGMAIPLTLGVSTIGVAMAAPAIHNARKKREIIEKHLNKRNATHHTRKRDVLGSMAVSGTIGVVTLGVGTMGADAVATAGAEHGIQSIVANETAIKIVTHAALDGAGMAVEHKHTDHLKKKDALKAFKKAGVFKAVQDAKAAEAGYSIQQPYNNQGHAYPYAAGSSSQAPAIPPPPPYSAAVPQTPGPPTYVPNMDPNGYPQDFKAPVAQTPVPQGQHYMMPNATGQQPVPQHYGYSPQQVPLQQQVPQQQHASPQQYIPPPGHSSTASVSAQVFSPPQTPAAGYPPQVAQTHQGIHSPVVTQPQPHMQHQEQPSYFPQTVQTPATIPSYNPAASSQTYNLTAMGEALPTLAAYTPVPTTPYQPPPQPQQLHNAALPTPPQETTPSHLYPTAQAGFVDPKAQPTPAGYPPSVSLPPQPTPQPVLASQVPPPEPFNNAQAPLGASLGSSAQYSTGAHQPAVQGFQPQPHQYSTCFTPQPTGSYHQTGVPPPPPQPTDPNRRDSTISVTQHSYNPQHYPPISHNQQAYTHPTYPTAAAPTPTPQAPQTSVQYQAPPSPYPTVIANPGTYYSAPPPAGQPQEHYKPGAPQQNPQLAYQPQHGQQSYYPPTPVSLPNSLPAV
ncbi:hypothetical protein ACJ41O_009027 [Fusarium nematophilum]